MLLQQIIALLATLALPVAILCIVDDWFLRPRRQAAAPLTASGEPAPDPAVMRVLYFALPVLIIAAVYRLLTAERMDFSAVLVAITIVSGVVWAIDHFLLRRWRDSLARAAGREPATIAEPGTVDYARSFFPVAAVLLVLRSFLFEPYRIPSDSMMPTLLDGDFIVVNKFSYGLRWPVSHKLFYESGSPERGDIAVFRYPEDPGINYIKRVVGLPGDLVEVRDDRLIINGEPVPFEAVGRYNDGCYANMRLARERLGDHEHEVLHCLTGESIVTLPLASCNREIAQGYVCSESDGGPGADSGDRQMRVPERSYLMVGDNRDNSTDGRYFGFVDETLLVGKATRIWFNWDLQRTGGPQWSRIGIAID
jgi:signal peptidase I